MPMVLGQSARSVQQASGEVLWLVLWIVVAAVVVAALALVLRKWLLRGQDEPAVGFSLRDMRRLHEAGRLSDQEYAQAKAAMLARSRAELGALDDLGGPGAAPRPVRADGVGGAEASDAVSGDEPGEGGDANGAGGAGHPDAPPGDGDGGGPDGREK